MNWEKWFSNGSGNLVASINDGPANVLNAKKKPDELCALQKLRKLSG